MLFLQKINQIDPQNDLKILITVIKESLAGEISQGKEEIWEFEFENKFKMVQFTELVRIFTARQFLSVKMDI